MNERPRGAATQAGLPLLLMLSVAARVAVALRPLKYIDGITIPDDAYISLEIARNIAHGHGPWYGLDFTNGYQPLYAFLMVPAYWIWPTDPVPPVHAALLLSTVFDTVTLWILFRLVVRLTESRAAAWTAGLAWALSPYVIGATLNGLETAIAVCFVAASISTFERLVTDDVPGAGLDGKLVRRLGWLLGFAVFARVDALLLAAVIGSGLILVWQRAGRAATSVVSACLQIAALAVAVNVPRFLYSFHYTGELLPHSGEAVRFISLSDVNHVPTLHYYLHQVKLGFAALATGDGALLAGILAAGVVALSGRSVRRQIDRRRAAFIGVLLAYSVAMFFAYTLYIFGPWFYDRYLFPLTVPILILFALVVDRAIQSVTPRSLRAGAATAIAAITFGAAIGPAQSRFAELYLSTDTFARGYMNLGLWARQRFPAGTRIGGSQTGALAYFAPELVVVNLDGVVNRACFEALQQYRDLEYIRSVGLQYVVNWKEGDEFLMQHSHGATEADLPVVEHIKEFGSWWHPWVLFAVRK